MRHAGLPRTQNRLRDIIEKYDPTRLGWSKKTYMGQTRAHCLHGRRHHPPGALDQVRLLNWSTYHSLQLALDRHQMARFDQPLQGLARVSHFRIKEPRLSGMICRRTWHLASWCPPKGVAASPNRTLAPGVAQRQGRREIARILLQLLEADQY